jgi:hypothetical protein
LGQTQNEPFDSGAFGRVDQRLVAAEVDTFDGCAFVTGKTAPDRGRRRHHGRHAVERRRERLGPLEVSAGDLSAVQRRSVGALTDERAIRDTALMELFTDSAAEEPRPSDEKDHASSV